MFRRRRKARSTWFPNLGITVADESDNSAQYSYFRTSLQPDVNSAVPPWSSSGGIYKPMDIIALVPDTTPEVSGRQADVTLRDYVEGQEWALDSIVGSIHVGCNAVNFDLDPGQSPSAEWATIAVTCGFFVADAEEGNTVVPAEDGINLDPTSVDNIRSPWIWRRTWVLSNPGTIFSGQQTSGGWPTTNSFVTGNVGPGIRTKSKRRIRRNQRIWFVSACTGFDFSQITVSGAANDQPIINILADLRICGKMRKARNVSAF